MDLQYRPSSLRNRPPGSSPARPRSYHERTRQHESYHFALGSHGAAPERSTRDGLRPRIEEQLQELFSGGDVGDFFAAAMNPETYHWGGLQEWFSRIEAATDQDAI
ncbi:MAG: hypothetical protein ACYCW6_01550, partial [Candidatus Xenobia bacterium]